MNAKSVVRELVRLIEEKSKKYAGSYIVSVKVRAGELSEVDPHTLSSAFAEAVHDTPYKDTSLTVETVVPEAVCDQCGHEFLFDETHACCEKCGSLRLALHGGDKLYCGFHFDKGPSYEHEITYQCTERQPVSA